MIINTKVTINRPREQVWEFFDNTDNLHKWIQGLKAYQHMSGDEGSIGAKGVYTFQENGKVIEMKDEILAKKKPEEFSNVFHHKDFDMIVNYSLFDEGNSTTTFICNTEYKFRSPFWKLFTKLARSKMEKRQREDIGLLKQYVEMDSN